MAGSRPKDLGNSIIHILECVERIYHPLNQFAEQVGRGVPLSAEGPGAPLGRSADIKFARDARRGAAKY